MTRLSIEKVAEICHEANRAYCAALGDMSQLAWADAPKWQRDSAVEGVKFRLAHVFAEPSASHESWSAHKIADGWVYGEVKDPVAKTHPCLVAFDDLPPEQRVKDYIFVSIVESIRFNGLVA